MARIWAPRPDVLTSGEHTGARWAVFRPSRDPGLVLTLFGSPCSARAISHECTSNALFTSRTTRMEPRPTRVYAILQESRKLPLLTSFVHYTKLYPYK